MSALTPGAYIARRREQAGLTLEQVARAIDTEPHISERERRAWLAMIEADFVPLSDTSVATLFRVIRFDPAVLDRLRDHHREADRVSAPRLCRICACSDGDACFDGARCCSWAAENLCTGCAPLARAFPTTPSFQGAFA